jgi:hypothetical protein
MDIRFVNLLKDFATFPTLRVTGSWADGTNHAGSDLDLKVRDSGFGGKDYMKLAGELLQRHGLKLRSNQPGHLFVVPQDTDWLPYQIEVSDRFNKRPNKLNAVLIEGIAFKTY